MKTCRTKLFFSIIGFSFCILALTGCSQSYQSDASRQDPYDAKKAVEYSYEYGTTRNDNYANFDSNCTNYISQVLVAGGKEMDTPIAPEEGTRITYHNIKNAWFSDWTQTDPNRWKEFSVTTSFCQTEAFLDYWTNERDMTYTRYVNSMDGLLKLYDRAEPGDIVTLYHEDGVLAHLCLLAVKGDNQLLVNANTKDYTDHNILSISPSIYPEIGLLEME